MVILVFRRLARLFQYIISSSFTFLIKMGSNIFAAVTKAPSADTITEEANDTTTLLDNASSKMRGIESINVSTHLEELSKIRSLVQKIRYQQGLQTCSVATALATLKGVAKKLDPVFGLCLKELEEQLPNIMGELREAGNNLRQQLPGDISTALRNEANQGLQINAALGGNRPEGRVLTEAIANRSTSAAQINAPIYGDATSFLRDRIPATN